MTANFNVNTSASNIQGQQSVDGAQGTAGIKGKAKVIFEDNQISIVAADGTKKVFKANSPDPVLAQLILWLNAEGPAQIDSYGEVVNVDAFLKTVELRYQEIVTKVLEEWNKQVAEDAKRVKEYLKSDEYRRQQELKSVHHRAMEENRQMEAGIKSASAHEGWLKSLTPAERTHYDSLSAQMPYLEQRYNLDVALSRHIDSLSKQVGATSGISGAVAGGLGQQLTLAGAIVAQLQSNYPTGKISTDSVTSAAFKFEASYAVDTSVIVQASMNMSVNLAIAQTLSNSTVEAADHHAVAKKFSKNYAQEVLKTINGDDFPNTIMAILSNRAEGQELTREELTATIDKAKLLYLAASVALLYKMSSSYKGEGGGITEREFLDILNGDLDGGHGTKELVEALHGLMSQVPESQSLIANFAQNLNSRVPVNLLSDPKEILENFYFEKPITPFMA